MTATTRLSRAPLVLAVAAGGALGSIGRVAFEALGPAAPWSTLAINLVGSLLLGLLAPTVIDRPGVPRWLAGGLGTGLLGGFTTMSTLAVQTLTLGLGGSAALAALAIGANLLLGLGAAWLGLRLGERLRPAPGSLDPELEG